MIYDLPSGDASHSINRMDRYDWHTNVLRIGAIGIFLLHAQVYRFG